MASGSSYKSQQPTESPAKNRATSAVPPRATRHLNPASASSAGLETEPARQRSRRSSPAVSEVNTQSEETPRSRRTAPQAAAPRQDPDLNQLLAPPQKVEPHPLERHRPWLPRLVLTVVCVVIGALVLTIAGIYVRQPQGSPIPYTGQSFPIQLGGSYQAFNTWNNSTGPIPTETPLPKNPGPYSVLGKPTISVKLINTVLASYHSPTAGMGQSLYDLGVKYGIDPVYALAFFMHESLFGTTGEARVTLSLGNERCIPDRPCIDQDRGGYAKMNSWEDGFEHWYKLIRNLYVAQWGRVTVDQIIPKYAPNSDGNNEKAYIATLKHEVDVWRAGGIRP